jgi:MbtH protein
VTSPFDDPDASFLVLINHKDQHSLWPALAKVPDGWTIAHPGADRATCIAYVEEHWTNLRPAGR